MNCLLIGGAPSVGKSESIFRLTQYLITIGFKDTFNLVPDTFKDFNAVLEGKNRKGEQIRIIINTPTDTKKIIQEFKRFYDKHGNYNILISSVRDQGSWPRNEFFNILNLSKDDIYIVEFPFAKITRRGKKFDIALKWYNERNDKQIINILENKPFLR